LRLNYFFNSEKVLNVKELKSFKGIDQIERYRTYTNNFSPEGLAKLKPEEILHLNLCDWLAPKAIEINERIRKAGGLKISETRNGIEYITEIYELDLFHSVLGELKPGSIRNHTKGGHLLIPELKAALLDIGEIEHIGNGFFDMQIKYAGKISDRYELKSYFPLGVSVEETVLIIEDAIKMPASISFGKINIEGRVPVNIVNKLDCKFWLHIEKGVARYYPINPKK